MRCIRRKILHAYLVKYLIFFGLIYLKQVNSYYITADCPEACECDDRHKTVLCANLRNQYDSIPSRRSDLTVGLHLVDMEFLDKTLESSNLTSYPNLEILHITMTNLEVVRSRTFYNIPKLSQIGLTANKIELIEPYAFAGTNLSILDLSNNQNMKIVEFSFTGIFGIRSLNLRNNKNIIVSYDMFAPILPFLTSLNIAGTGITQFDPRILQAAQRLRSLNVEENPDLVCDCQLIWLKNRAVEKNVAIRGLPKDCDETKVDANMSCMKRIAAEVDMIYNDQWSKSTDGELTTDVPVIVTVTTSSLSGSRERRIMTQCYSFAQLCTAVIVSLISAMAVFVSCCLLIRCCKKCCFDETSESYKTPSSGGSAAQSPVSEKLLTSNDNHTPSEVPPQPPKSSPPDAQMMPSISHSTSNDARATGGGGLYMNRDAVAIQAARAAQAYRNSRQGSFEHPRPPPPSASPAISSSNTGGEFRQYML